MKKAFSAVCAVVLVLVTGGATQAQRLIDWTVHTSAVPEALVRGAAAVFWNPAAIAPEAGRIEGLVLDLEGPSTTGLGGLGIAAAAQQSRTYFGAGYQHLEIGGIPITDDSPVTDPANEFKVTEDRLALAAAQPLSENGLAGAMVQVERSSTFQETRNLVSFGAGFQLRAAGSRFDPTFAGAAFVGQHTRWIAGVDARALTLRAVPIDVRVGYGLAGTERESGPSHRASVLARWQNRVTVGATLLGQGGSDGTSWSPVVSGDLRLGRYLLGVMREGMPNGFGATYSYRLSVRF